MRVENWNPNVRDQSFEDVAVDRLVKAAELIRNHAKSKAKPRTGKLRNSVRVVRRKTKSGKAFTKKRNVRVYAGSKEVYYARFVEYGTAKTAMKAFLRPALNQSIPEIKSIIGVR